MQLENIAVSNSAVRTDVPDGTVNPTESIKLLKVITTYFRGGTEGQVLNLVRSLDRKKFDLKFACLRKGGNILDEFEQLDIPITEFKIKNLYRPQTFLQQLRFAAYMRAEHIQIVHSYNFYSNVFTIPAAKMAGIPVVLASIRDRGIYLTPAQKKVQKWICSFADRILVNADSIREWLLEQDYPEHKILVIKNGIDLSRYTKIKGSSQVRQGLGIPDSVPVIVMMSRLNTQKGVEDFIKAAALVNKSHPDVRFLIVGAKLSYEIGVFMEDNAYLQELQKLAEDHGIGNRITFAGHRTDIPEILAEATISVLPSYSEGLSNSLLESMAAGIPVVATNVGGNPELIKNDINGILIPVKSPELLAQAAVKILDNPDLARRFGQQSKKMAIESYSLEKMTADTQKLYIKELKKSLALTMSR